MELEKTVTPLFWCLKVNQQAALMQFYYDQFGTCLDIPKVPMDMPHKIPVSESTEEIERIMRLPSHSHKLEGR